MGGLVGAGQESQPSTRSREDKGSTSLPEDDSEYKTFLLITNLVQQYFANQTRVQPEPALLDAAISTATHERDYGHSANQMVATVLGELGHLYYTRYKTLGNLADLDSAIDFAKQEISLLEGGDIRKVMALANLGLSYRARFDHLGILTDSDAAIDCQTHAFLLAPQAHPIRLGLLNDLGNTYRSRFRRLRRVGNIDTAIGLQSQVVKITPDEFPYKPIWLGGLGGAYYERYQIFNQTRDLQLATACYLHAASLAPDTYPLKHLLLSHLGELHCMRFASLGEQVYLDAAIEHQHRAVALASGGAPNDVSETLERLATSYRTRFQHFGSLSDLGLAIEFQANALSATPKNQPTYDTRLANLAEAYHSRYIYLGQGYDLDLSIELQRKALASLSDDHPFTYRHAMNLGRSFRSRFDALGNIADIDASIKLLTKSIAATPAELPDRYIGLYNLGSSYLARFKRLGERADLDMAINYGIQAVSATPDKLPVKFEFVRYLGHSYLTKFESLEDLGDLDLAVNCFVQAVSLVPSTHPAVPAVLNDLGLAYQTRFISLGQHADIDLAVLFQSQGISRLPEGHPWKCLFLNNLGNSHRCRFGLWKRAEDLNKSIACGNKAASLMPDGHANTSALLNGLGDSYYDRFENFGDPADVERSIDCYKRAARSVVSNPDARFIASLRCARISYNYQSSSSLEGYQQLINLIPHVVWLGSPVTRRYDQVTSMGNAVAEAVATAIELKRYDLALEWQEVGHSIVWNQILQLRTPLDELRSVYPTLADKIQDVASQLDYASSAKPMRIESLLNVATMEQAAQKHRQLASEWAQAIDDIRRLPGFHGFLAPPKIEELKGVAIDSIVVALNVHMRRCDALALLPNSASIVHVPLPLLSDQVAHNLQGRLVNSLRGANYRHSQRRPVYPETDSNDEFEDVMGELWTIVVKPVLEKLGLIQNTPPAILPRITWCTTGPLAFLPFHAAGCYNEPEARTYKYAVSSYTPNLSVLSKASRAPANQFQGILAVSQAETAGYAPLPGTVAELDHIQELAFGLPFTRLHGEAATANSVLDAMKKRSWAHLACHASQNSDDPTSSAFQLHRSQLDLSTLVHERLEHVDLAFLSACQTATGHERLPDEAIHLAAGMLLVGYQRVVATMWSIRDEDAPVIVKEFYSRVLEGGVPDSRKAATALHDAIGYLRAKVGERNFAQWVPFVHIGL
ncbi:hypothetical protein FRC08_000690 [Ceratobasidium sp. 394]|nr:hypothetical protein FRC08_000690 [Ceratobasidium sp. 394]